MDLVQGITTRRSIRRFEDRPVDHAVLCRIVQTAAFAPSWKNVQPARYHVVENKALLQRFADEAVLGFAFNAKTIAHAPALVLLTYVEGRSGFEPDGSYATAKADGWEMFDAGIAAQTFSLAAHAEGLGSVILGIFDEERVARILPLPAGERLAALIAVGWPAQAPTAPPRKSAEQLLCFDA